MNVTKQFSLGRIYEMEKYLVVLVGFLGLLSEISGRVLLNDTKCGDPLLTVVGNHHVPRKPCPDTDLNFAKESALRQKYLKQLSVGQPNPDLKEINKVVDELVTLHPTRERSFIESDFVCVACRAGIEIYKFLINNGMTKEKILNFLYSICINLAITTSKICDGVLNLFGETLMNVIDELKPDPELACSIILNLNCENAPVKKINWRVTLPNSKKPPVLKTLPPPATARKLKVLHISDTHWDTQYEVGSWAECNLPLCCRKENVLPNKNATKAGKYGGWKCDTPEETFDSVLDHIVKQHPDLDYIIWTGDIPAHDLWNQTRDVNLGVLKKTVTKLLKYFPKTPLYPALGNHESVPSNMFPTINKNTENPMDWLFKALNTQWSRWLPKKVFKTVRWGGFYTTLIRPGLRLISMNMNYCYKMNWWLVKDNQDPHNELKWLVKVLQVAEHRKEKVHIIGHVPPGSKDCIKTWQTNYYKIMNRYEATVTAQFFGHTHADEFEVFYDMKNTSRPFGVAYVGPSVTTYMYHNPSYRIYYVEGDYRGSRRYVLDHETWYLDLEKANKENRAEWKKLYSVKDAYKMKSLYPEDWHNLYLRIKDSNETLQQYHKYYWNDSPKRPVCGKSCRRNRLCDIRCCDQYGDPDDLYL